METISLVGSIVSVILAGFAIWLSVTFYRLSTGIAESTRQAARGIEAAVTRLETLFDRLYADTFGLMKETVSNMRKHIWPETTTDTDKLVEERADEKVTQLKAEFGNELSSILSKMGKTDRKLETVHSRLESLVDKVINQSRRAEKEAREETLRSTVIAALRNAAARKGTRKVRMDDFVHMLPHAIIVRSALEEVFRLRDEGLVALPKKVKTLSDTDPYTLVTLLAPLE